MTAKVIKKVVKFRKGDRVLVEMKAESFEKGWDNAWVTDMNRVVGKKCTVIKDEGKIGIRLEDDFCYPKHVLKKVAK